MADSEFEQMMDEAVMRLVSGTFGEASDIANSCLQMLIERSIDIQCNPTITLLIMRQVIEANIEEARENIVFPPMLRKMPPEIIAKTKCKTPFDLFVYFIDRMFDSKPFKKREIR